MLGKLKQKFVSWLLKGVHIDVLHIGKHSVVISGTGANMDGQKIENVGAPDSDDDVPRRVFSDLTGRWTLAQAHRGADGKIMVFKGPAADPVEEDKPAGGGDAFLVVAAADTPVTLKNRADLVCDGTATTGGDQVEINTALGAADVVILCPGTYWIDASISMASGKSLIGGGVGCVLKLKNGIDANINMIVNSDTTNGNDHIVVRNLKLDGNKANQTTGTQRGIYFYKVAPSGSTPGCRIEECFIENFRTEGIYLEESLNNIIASNTFQNNHYGIYLIYTSNNNIISGNVSQANTDGITLDTSCNNSVIIGNICQGNTGEGINLMSCDNNTITGNNIQGSGDCGIYYTRCDNGIISGNIIRGNTNPGIYMYRSHNNTVTGNTLQGNGYGIELEGHVDENIVNNTISANTCQGNGVDGIYLCLAHNNTIIGNTCLENSQNTDNTYDNICIITSDYNLIMGNVCRRGTQTNKPKYGINVSDDACDRNCLIGNDLYDSGSTGDLNDVPTTNPTLKHDNRDLAGTGWLAEV